MPPTDTLLFAFGQAQDIVIIIGINSILKNHILYILNM